MREDDIYRLIGRRLRLRRRLLDMTQGQVATRCGLTFQQIQKYEAGITAMPIGRLVMLADVLQMPIESLVEGLCPSPPRSNDDGESWTGAEPEALRA